MVDSGAPPDMVDRLIKALLVVAILIVAYIGLDKFFLVFPPT